MVGKNQILIFGGCDIDVKDVKWSYLLDLNDKTLTQKHDLKKSHVFICSPLVYGNHVYVLGNEYYHKNKNISRYNIKTDEWGIIFW